MSEPVLGELGVAWSRTRAGAIQRAWPKALLLFGRPWLAPAGWLAEQYRLACRPRFLFLDTTLAALRTRSAWQGSVVCCSSGWVAWRCRCCWCGMPRTVSSRWRMPVGPRPGFPMPRWWCCLLRAPAARGGPGPFNRTLTAFLNAPRSHGRAPASA
jgi:hypothetical protein